MKTQISALELELNTENAKRIREVAQGVEAFRKGKVILASGKESDRYFEGERVALWPEGAYLIGKAIFEDILKDIDVDYIGGLATGAYPIATAVSLISHMQGKPIPSFVVREVRSTHGIMREIEGHLKEGSKVAIVDDVITTGGSIKKAIEAVEKAGCTVVKVIVLVDRKEGGSDELRQRGYDFTAILGYPAPGEVTLD